MVDQGVPNRTQNSLAWQLLQLLVRALHPVRGRASAERAAHAMSLPATTSAVAAQPWRCLYDTLSVAVLYFA